MRLKAPILSVESKDPFKSDVLRRKPIADVLTALVKGEKESFVVGLYAPWGNGKTTFIRMWREHLRSEEVSSLYFNAWESDFSSDPLAVLIGELEHGVKSLKKEEEIAVREKLAQAKDMGVAILKRALPLAVKIGSAGIIDMNELTEEAISEWGSQWAKDQIAAYDGAKSTVASFKSKLSELAAEFGPHPLVIVVDELDRCRPPYAISILECIKHFFSVPNVVFLVAADREQIEGAVAGVYGSGVNAQGYLRKLIDLDFNLPSPSRDEFFRAQFSRFGLDGEFHKRKGSPEDYKEFSSALPELMAAAALSLRDQERCFALISLSLRTTPADHILWPILLSVLIVMKISRPARFSKIASTPYGANSIEVFRSFLNEIDLKPLYSKYFVTIAEAQLLSALDYDLRDDILLSYKKESEDNSLGEEQRRRSSEILEIYRQYKFRYNVRLSYFIAKIDLIAEVQGN